MVTLALQGKELRTLFLQVPADDWTRVKYGQKTEFRTTRADKAMMLSGVEYPTPVVAYNAEDAADRLLMVLVEHRFEPLFNVSLNHGSWEREGFESYDHFRREWRARHGGEYHPMEQVHVWQIRRWERADYKNMAIRVLNQLYGYFLADLKRTELPR